MCKIHRAIVSTAAVLLGFAATTQAQLTITVGDHVLLPETPGQTVDLIVSGGSNVAGMNLYIVVGDGTSGPVITSVDVVNGTVFDSPSSGFDIPLPGDHQYGASFALTNPLDLPASGKIATITFDTSGISEGSWALSLNDPTFGVSEFLDASAEPVGLTIHNGSLNVPEPMTLGLFALSGLLFFQRRMARIQPHP